MLFLSNFSVTYICIFYQIRYQIEALPTLILFNKGEPIERFMGYRSADELEKEVRAVLNRIGS